MPELRCRTFRLAKKRRQQCVQRFIVFFFQSKRCAFFVVVEEEACFFASSSLYGLFAGRTTTRVFFAGVVLLGSHYL